MISLEKAKKLKEAGLVWEPQEGDLVYHSEAEDYFYITTDDMEDYVQATRIDKEYAYSIAIFLPRLDQLLAEIEKRGYKWFLETDRETYFIRIIKPGDTKEPVSFKAYAKSLVDAAASALLWIYERRK